MAGKKPNLIHVGIVGAALGGLAFDKFVLRAEADTVVPTESLEQTAGVDSSADTQEVSLNTEPLGERFEQAGQRLSLPAFRRLDAFSEPAEEIVLQAESENPTHQGTGFTSRHQLTAVLSQPSGDIAVVDGRLLKIGDTVEGIELIKIETDGAIFKLGEQEIRLPLDRPGLDR